MMSRLADFVDPKQAAVVVIDVQNSFCHPEGRYAKAGNDVSVYGRLAERIQGFLGDARRLGARVIFVRGSGDSWTHMETAEQLNGRGLVPYGSEATGESALAKVGRGYDDPWEWDFYLVGPQGDEPVVSKDRYSAFIGTDLDLILRSQGIKTLILTGLAGNVCVESTARDGFMMGYRIVFTSNCTESRSPEVQRGALLNIDKFYGTVVTSQEVLEAWQGAVVPVRGQKTA